MLIVIHNRLKKFISTFNGVATKYLKSYIELFDVLDRINFDISKSNIRTILLNTCKNTMKITNKDIRLGVA